MISRETPTPKPPEERPQDNPPVGGVKDTANAMYNIVPFVNETVSNKSLEDMRYSVENQFKQLADVTRSLVIKLNKFEATLASLGERVTKLEEGGGTPP